MATEDDLAHLLPDPPPPRPDRRDAAIAAAMRRFDGIAEPASSAAPGPVPGRARPWWTPGTQLGAVATVALVGLISVSVALHNPADRPRAPTRASTAGTSRAPNATAPRSIGPETLTPGGGDRAAAPVSPEEQTTPVVARAEPPAGVVVDGKVATGRIEASRSSSDVAPPPPPPAPPPPPPPPPAPVAAPPAEMAASEPPVVVTASRSAQGLAASPRASKAAAADEANSDVIVTGARIAGRDPYAARGDWNACTVNDPEQSLRGCRGAVGIGAKGQAGEAAASLSQGLALAWQNDWRGAIAAFDRAIALKPKSAFAYLNRGLAYQREGDLARAAADLDFAIKYAPYAARGYYNRGLLRRERGDVRGANTDAARAAEMDSGYPDPVAPARR